MKKFISIYLLSIIFLASGCKKVLDTESLLYIDQSQSIVDKRSAQAALVGAYNALSQNSYQGNTYRYVTNLLSDNIKWVGNTPTNREFDVYSVFATNTRVQELWSSIYKTINIANNIIEKLAQVNDVTLDQAERNKERGEAYFLRALSYFDLVRLWGNVPLVSKATQSPEDAKDISNSNPTLVYQFIGRDLDSAEEQAVRPHGRGGGDTARSRQGGGRTGSPVEGSEERPDPPAEIGQRRAVDGEALGLRPRRRRRVGDAPVGPPRGPREVRAGLGRVIAHRQHVIEFAIQELRERLGAGPGVVDPGLVQDALGHRVHGTRRHAPRRLDRHAVARQLVEQRLGHDRAARVAGTEDEDPRRPGAHLQGFRSSISPLARNTTSSAMFVTRSPIRSM